MRGKIRTEEKRSREQRRRVTEKRKICEGFEDWQRVAGE
jgi:hypothetical protein